MYSPDAMWQFHYFFSALSFLFALFLIERMLKERRSPSSTLAWIFVMIFFPYFGIALYLLLGVRKIKKSPGCKAVLYPSATPGPLLSEEITLPIERLLKASGVPPKSAGNELKLLRSGESAYAVLVETLANAKREIYISTFILGTDSVADSILQILEKKARAGVRVRLLLDGLGSFWVSRKKLKSLRQSGAKACYFLPLVHIPFFGHSNLRNHRKIVVVDGEEAIVGGMNLASEYIGPSRSPDRWLDLAIRVRGPSVRDFLNIFKADWFFAAREKLPSSEPSPESSTGSFMSDGSGGSVAQVVASGPDMMGDPLYDSIATGVFSAQKRIWIATPYFIPDDTLSKALEIAAKRGVDVRIFMPKKSNHFLADLCRGSYMRQVERAGGKILLYTPSMMHAKLFLVDERYSILGSANLDMRSLFLNYEAGLLMYSKPAIGAVEKWFESILPECELSNHQLRESWKDVILEGVARVFSPIL